MASHGHPGQIKNSSSPKVVSSKATKAPSVSAAKPRFRSRTGCWTCRGRKVKCDERGRNPETVAYGGPLSTSSGCKRCEDSARPCYGYGAQAPNRPFLKKPFPAPCNPGEVAGESKSLYTFGHYNHENAGTLPYLPNYLATSDPSSMLSELAQWSWSPNSLKSGEHQSGSELQSPHLSSTSSTTSAAPLLPSASAGLHEAQASLVTPPLDLRRYSVPSVPTWNTATLERHHPSPYPNTGASINSCFLSNGNGSLNPGVVLGADESIGASGSADPLNIANPNYSPHSHSNMSNVPPNNTRTIEPHIRPNTHSVSRSHFVPVDFGRPHTSSGVSLLHINQAQQVQARNYPSQMIPHHEFLVGFPEIPCNPYLSPVTTNCSEFETAGWSGSTSGTTHSKLSEQSSNMNAPLISSQNSPLVSKEHLPMVQNASIPQRPEFLKSVPSTEASSFSSLNVRYESYPSPIELHPDSHINASGGPNLHSPSSKGSFHSPHVSGIDYRASLPLSREGGAVGMQRRLSSAADSKGRQNIPFQTQIYIESLSSERHRAIADRKDSSSSSSSLSTFENNSSPRVSSSKRLSTNQACSPSNPSSASSPASATKLAQNPLLSPNQLPIGHHSPSMDVFKVLQQKSHSPWNAPDAGPPQDPRGHEFSISRNDVAPGNVKTEIMDHESLISTANSTFSSIRINKHEPDGSPANYHPCSLIDEPVTPFPIMYKFPAPDSSLTLVDSSQHFSADPLN